MLSDILLLRGLMKSNKELLGQRIKEIRKKKGLSQEKLAELAQIEPTSLSNIENGYNYPSFKTLDKLLEILKIDYLEVFNFEHHNAPDDLIAEIVRLLKENPDKLQDFYKIICALTT